MRYLDLDNFEKIGDEDLAALCKLSKLTILDAIRDIDFHFGFYTSMCITDTGMHSLGSLSASKELCLESGVNIKNMGIQYLSPLISLTKLSLRLRDYIPDEGAEY